jgi:hypothetical protein
VIVLELLKLLMESFKNSPRSNEGLKTTSTKPINIYQGNFIKKELIDSTTGRIRQGSPETIPIKGYSFFGGIPNNIWNNESRSCEKIAKLYLKPNKEKSLEIQRKTVKQQQELRKIQQEAEKKKIQTRVKEHRDNMLKQQKLRNALQIESEQIINFWNDDVEECTLPPDKLRTMLNTKSKDRSKITLKGFAKNPWNDLSNISVKTSRMLLSGSIVKKDEESIAYIKKKMEQEEERAKIKQDLLLRAKEETRDRLAKKHVDNLLLEKKTGRNIKMIHNITLEHIPLENLEPQSVTSIKAGYFPVKYPQTAERLEFERNHQSSPILSERIMGGRQVTKNK